MRVKVLIGGMVLLGILVTSCASNKEVSRRKTVVKKELSADKKQQYYYIFIEANRKKLLGDFNGALALYYQCLELDPTADAAMAEISKINEITQNYDVAIKYAESAVEHNNENKWYKINLAKLYLVKNNIPKAIEVYEALQENFSTDLEIPFNLAALYARTGEFKKAIDLYDIIENKVGVNENLSIGKQRLYQQIGNKTKAFAEIERLIKHYPNVAQYYGIIAEMYLADNLFLKAEENYNKLFELDSTNHLGQLSIIDFYRKKMDYDNAFLMIEKVTRNKEIPFEQKLMVYVSLLNNQSELGIYNQRIKDHLIILQEVYPNEKDAHTLYADFFIKMNQLSEAQTQLEYIVENFEGTITIWEQLLSLYSYKNNMEDLYTKSTTAIDSFPEHALFYLFNGVSANRVEKHQEAIKVLNLGLKYAENNKDLELDFYTNLGEAYHEAEQYKQSDYYFEIVLKRNPDNLYVINNYSYYLSLREEKLEYAESLSKKTIQAEPKNNTFLDTYAWILYKLERYQDALYYITQAIENGGIDSDVVVEHYGDILYRTGSKDKAVEIWELSKEMGNQSEELKEKINKKSLD